MALDGNPYPVPLHCCDVCGWAFTGSDLDAVEMHRRECPACAGSPALAFSFRRPAHSSGPTEIRARSERGSGSEPASLNPAA